MLSTFYYANLYFLHNKYHNTITLPSCFLNVMCACKSIAVLGFVAGIEIATCIL